LLLQLLLAKLLLLRLLLLLELLLLELLLLFLQRAPQAARLGDRCATTRYDDARHQQDRTRAPRRSPEVPTYGLSVRLIA
jgi:hypothetical protein